MQQACRSKWFLPLFSVALAHGRSGAPYDWLAAIAGLAYIAAVVVQRIRG